MLKKVLLTGAAAAFIINANAQTAITLTQNNVNLQVRDVNVTLVDTASLTPPTEGSNQTWDFSNLSVIENSAFLYSPSTNNQFSNNAITENMIEEFVSNGEIEYYRYTDLNTEGLSVMGISADYQAYPIGEMTGSPEDTFYVPQQTQVYSSPQHFLKFPATENSLWTNMNRRVLNFEISLKNFMMNKTPGSKVSNIIARDVVAGWGKLRLPLDSGKSQWYDVLMVNRGIRQSDSFYLNASPAPEAMLAAFGLEQDMVTEDYRTYFYRAGDFYPLMIIGYGEDFSRQNPQFAFFTTDNVMLTGIKETKNVFTPALFPNPVTNQQLQVSFVKDNSADWNLNIVNVLGQTVQTKTVNAAAGKITMPVQLSADISNGLYFIQLTDANGTLRGTGKVLVRK